MNTTNNNSTWSYWETQKSLYLNLIVLVSIVSFIVINYSKSTLNKSDIVSSILAIAILWIMGGIRVSVNTACVRVYMGIFSFKLFDIKINDIKETYVHSFSPIKHFGGWGIRINREMKAYFWRGNKGVVIVDDNGRKTLIGSNNPEKLAEVINSVREGCIPLSY